MVDYLNREYQKAKEIYEAAKKQCDRLRRIIDDLEQIFPDGSLNSSNKRFRKMPITECVSKILSEKGDLTTKEIHHLLIENGKIFYSKYPLNSLSATLHNASKNKRHGICHIGFSKWGLRKNEV